MITIYFLFNLFLLILVIKKFSFYSYETMIFAIFFVYGFSFYLDYHLFGIDTIIYGGLGQINYSSVNYQIICFLYTLFLLFYYIALNLSVNVKFKPINSKGGEINKITSLSNTYSSKNNFGVSKVILLFYTIFSLFLCTILFNLQRLDKIDFLTSNKLIDFVSIIGTYIFIIVASKFIHYKSRVSFLEKLFILSSISLGLLSGGREIFIYLFLISLAYFNSYKSKILPLVMSFAGIIFVSIWKAVSIFLFVIGDRNAFWSFLINDFRFSITSLDPIGSLLLLNNYLNGSKFFSDYYFSYFFNTINQFFGALGIIDYDSISVSTVKYFDYASFSRGQGFAFSGILESMLNFGYLGPPILGFFTGYILSVLKNKNLPDFKITILKIFFTIIMLKLVRTELAVVLKLYLIPMIIAYSMFFKNFKLRRN